MSPAHITVDDSSRYYLKLTKYFIMMMTELQPTHIKEMFKTLLVKNIPVKFVFFTHVKVTTFSGRNNVERLHNLVWCINIQVVKGTMIYTIGRGCMSSSVQYSDGGEGGGIFKALGWYDHIQVGVL